MCPLFMLDRNTWYHTTVYTLFIFDRNTCYYTTVCKLFISDWNTWYYTTVYTLCILYRNTWYHTTVCKLFILDRNTWYTIVFKLFVLDSNTCYHIPLLKTLKKEETDTIYLYKKGIKLKLLFNIILWNDNGKSGICLSANFLPSINNLLYNFLPLNTYEHWTQFPNI